MDIDVVCVVLARTEGFDGARVVEAQYDAASLTAVCLVGKKPVRFSGIMVGIFFRIAPEVSHSTPLDSLCSF